MKLVDRNELTTKLKRNAQMLESESQIKNQIVQQKPVSEGIENEIESPRCYDTMTLCSDFDNPYYLVAISVCIQSRGKSIDVLSQSVVTIKEHSMILEFKQ